MEFTLSELAAGAAIPVTTAHREMARLVDAALVRSRPVGRTRLHRANVDHPAAAALTELLTRSFGPAPVGAEEFADLPDVDRIVVFGSWAARHTGEDGPPPADVDVLVVGAPPRAQVYEAAERARQRLGLPVNPVVRTPAQWAAADDPLTAQVLGSAHLIVLDRTAGPPDDAMAGRTA